MITGKTEDTSEIPPGGVRADEPAAPPQTAWRKVAAGCIVAAGLAFVVMMYAVGLTPTDVTQRDYIEYWAAGQQLAHHANPYDYAVIFAIERHNGMRTGDPRMSFSPPVALEFFLPLGWVSAKTGLISWLMAELACLLVSLWLLWRLNGRPDSRLHLVGLAFTPVLACQMAGQLGTFFLLCLVLFLVWHDTRPFLAGAALMPLALKPHLIVPLAIALVIWCVVRGRMRVLLGGLVALAASCAASMAIDPHSWTEYRAMASVVPIADLFVPTFGMVVRQWIHPASRWIGYVPEAAACAWAGWYAWIRRKRWDWMREGQLAVMLSVACAPYSFVSDQCLLLPAVLSGLYRRENARRTLALFLLVDGAMLAGVLQQPRMTAPWYAFTAPAWLIWYLYATRDVKERTAAVAATD
ncbi:MAG TPA: glycosyltransferase family 87 protein [Terracidiphilus sp.]|nr:glycosyltransferase family 87 protein [Terracidiphilus sp.]